MLKLRGLTVALLAVGLLLAPLEAARAQQGVETREALAAELFDLTLGSELRTLFSLYVDKMIADDPMIEADHAAWLRANLPSLMQEMMVEAAERLTPLYAEAMTEEELRYQLDFYRTPMGRQIARKQMALSIPQELILAELTEEFLAQMLTKFCAAFDCDDEAAGQGVKR